MSEEARRAKTRERVRAWKARNKFLVKGQRKRRWERVKAALHKEGTPEPTRVTFQGTQGYMGKKEVQEVQETYMEPMDLAEGDRDTVMRQVEMTEKRTGRHRPAGYIEPEQKGGRVNAGRRAERVDGGAGAAGTESGVRVKGGEAEADRVKGGGSGVREGSAEERRVREWLRNRGRGVEVELEV